jgi:hypothetical protein
MALEIRGGFMQHADRQIEQIVRQVIQNESIAHEDKGVLNLEPHTEWISKGKAGVPVERRVRKVCILEDQHQFILHHQSHVAQQTDDQVACAYHEVSKDKAPLSSLNACSFDKGAPLPGQSDRTEGAFWEQLTLPERGV